MSDREPLNEDSPLASLEAEAAVESTDVDRAVPDSWRRRLGRRLRPALKILLALVVLAAAWMGMQWMLRHRVKAKRQKPKSRATLVEVTPAKVSDHRVVVKGMGRVRAAEEVALHPRVRGEVVSLSREMLPGGLVPEGHVLLRIDPSDYRVAVQQSTAAIKQAKAELQLEQGRQASARNELELLGSSAKDVNRDLVLRGPQLRKNKAAMESARATLRKARLDLKRTVIRSPINAVVLSRDVNVGTRVTETTRLARLVGTDAFWVELVLPVDQLKWVRVPGASGEPGAEVTIRDPSWSQEQSRTGRVMRLAPDLEEKGRMARLIVRIADPLALRKENRGKPRLLVGSWIEAVVQGSELKSVFVLPRRLLRGGTRVWLIDRQSRLDIRTVSLAFRGPDRVVVTKGLSAGDRLVVSDLSTPVKGTPLRVLDKRSRPRGRKRP